MFHCLVIKVCCVYLSDSSFILSHLFLFVKHFFKFFSNIFELRFCCRFVDDLDTLSYLLSFVNCEFHFSEILFNYLFFKNNYLRQLSYITIGVLCLSIIKFNFFRFSWKFILKGQFFSFIILYLPVYYIYVVFL